MLREDVEILCDYRTLTLFRLPRTEYALMLCKNSAYDTLAMQAGCGMAATGRVLKKRLKTISLQNKKNFLPRFLSVLVCAAIIIVCLTNPVLSYSSEYSTYIENYAALTDSDEREMHFISETTVSTYLVQTATLLSDISNGELGKKIGNGNLENFKRICIANEFLSDEIANEIRDLKADTVLSNKSCALVNYAIVQLLSNGNENAEEFKRNLLPVMISVDSMKKIHEKLSPEESERLMMCYNLGVPGADVQFSRYITDDMYELICSRINDESMKKMLNACYFKLNINNVSSELLDQLTGVHDAKRYLENETYIYICDVNLSEYELSRLYRVINSAAAGEQETIYYLKQNESGCSFAEAERLFKKAGFSYSEMLDEYTKLCETPYIYLSNTESNIMSGRSIGLIQKRFDENDFAYDFSATYELIETDGISYMYERNDKHAVLHIHALGLLNTIVFPMINLDDGVQITGKCNLTGKYIASVVYKLGLIETNSDGVIDINKKLSCGEGIYYAYRLIGAMENYYK